MSLGRFWFSIISTPSNVDIVDIGLPTRTNYLQPKRIVVKGFPLWCWPYFELEWRFNKTPLSFTHMKDTKITRQPICLNFNVCNQHNHMWGEEVNNRFQCTNLSWINKHFETWVRNKSHFLKMLQEKIVNLTLFIFNLRVIFFGFLKEERSPNFTSTQKNDKEKTKKTSKDKCLWLHN